MSSPYSNLNKSRKAPLPAFSSGHRSVPFRQTMDIMDIVRNSISDDVDEDRLLGEVTSQIAASQIKQRDPYAGGLAFPRRIDSKPGSRISGLPPPNDMDLMSSMMSRISQLELRVQFQAKEISDKERKINILEDKVKILNKSRVEGDQARIEELEKQNHKLQNEMQEMEAFLADYGMVWVGDDSSESDQDETQADVSQDTHRTWSQDYFSSDDDIDWCNVVVPQGSSSVGSGHDDAKGAGEEDDDDDAAEEDDGAGAAEDDDGAGAAEDDAGAGAAEDDAGAAEQGDGGAAEQDEPRASSTKPDVPSNNDNVDIGFSSDEDDEWWSSVDAPVPGHSSDGDGDDKFIEPKLPDIFAKLVFAEPTSEKRHGQMVVEYSDSLPPEWPLSLDTSSVPGEFKVDYNLVIENIKDLNILAGDGIGQVTHTTDGARLKMPDPVNFTLYANGILLFNGPFRPFSIPETQRCLRDIMDGYFPSELQARYPDGVPFLVTDKRDVIFRDKRSDVFKGTAQTLGGDTKPSRLLPSNLEPSPKPAEISSKPGQEETSELPGPKLTVDQFLKKLPSSVIREGKVIDIRGSLSDTLKGDMSKRNNTVMLVETEAVQDMKLRLEEDESSRPPSSRNIATLRIKAEDQTFILKMKFHETVGHIRQYLDKKRKSGAPSYQLVSSFPKKVFDDDSMTLEAAGLIPNATLHLKPKK